MSSEDPEYCYSTSNSECDSFLEDSILYPVCAMLGGAGITGHKCEWILLQAIIFTVDVRALDCWLEKIVHGNERHNWGRRGEGGMKQE